MIEVNLNTSLQHQVMLGSPTDDKGDFRKMEFESTKFGKIIVQNTSSGVLKESQISSDFMRYNSS